jgi:hypothetical protein
LLFGLSLGVGLLTVVVCVEYYVLVLAAAGHHPVQASALMGAFGCGRVVPMWLAHRCIASRGDEFRVSDVGACLRQFLGQRRWLAEGRSATLALALGAAASMLSS